MNKKKALVVSHERSGTSFLLNAIGLNFPMYLPEADESGKVQRIDIDLQGYNFADPEEMMKFLSDPAFHGLPIRNIFKSHHARDYFSDPEVWNYLQSEFHVFYAFRDVRDVMASFWRHIRKLGHIFGPQTFTASEFIRAKPSGGVTRYHGQRSPSNMTQRWNDHILSWARQRLPGVCYISYEQMSTNFGDIVKKIGATLEMPIPEKIIRPGVGGIHPGKGIVGNWRKSFNADDVEFISEYAKEAIGVLGIEVQDAIPDIEA